MVRTSSAQLGYDNSKIPPDPLFSSIVFPKPTKSFSKMPRILWHPHVYPASIFPMYRYNQSIACKTLFTIQLGQLFGHRPMCSIIKTVSIPVTRIQLPPSWLRKGCSRRKMEKSYIKINFNFNGVNVSVR